MSAPETGQTDVLIAGAGPAGLTVAIELGRRGISCQVVDPAERGAYKLPRTALTNVRSMEHLRRWGIAETLRSRNPLGEASGSDFLFCTGIAGKELHTFERPFVEAEPNAQASEVAEWSPQRVIEATLLEYAETLPTVHFRWGVRAGSFVQDDDAVRVSLAGDLGAPLVQAYDQREEVSRPTRADADAETIECRYLVGTDGSRSAVRKGLGIRLEGRADIAEALVYHVNVPDLKSVSKVGFPGCYWVVNGAFDGRYSSLIVPQDDRGGLQLFVLPLPQGCDPDDRRDVESILFASIGEEVEAELVDGIAWRLHSLIAPTFDQGRVFIGGDAAHLIPSFGGFGMNISLLDAVDLGWKLAAVLGGWGGPKLLASYTTERRAADLWVKQIQDENSEVLSPELYRPGLEDDSPEGEALRAQVKQEIIEAKTQEFSSLGCQLGYRYDDSPLVVADGTPAPPLDPIEYRQISRPGALSPHLWLSRARNDSLYDKLGPEFTLVRADPEADPEPIERAAGERGMPIATLSVPDADLRSLYGADLALIRPDQHLAWRGDGDVDPLALIDRVRGG